MKKILLLFILFSILLFSEEQKNEYSDGVVFPVNNRDYTRNIINLFNNAEKTVHILMLQGGYYPSRKDGINEMLYKSMFDAAKRGVEVVIILDQAGHNPSQSIKNAELGEYLKKNGVMVYYDDPSTTLHSKMFIVDSIYTVVGSTNWSYHALDKNNECSVLIKSKEIALMFEKQFKETLLKSFEQITVFD